MRTTCLVSDRTRTLDAETTSTRLIGFESSVHTPHQRPYTGDQLDDLGSDAGVTTLAECWVVGGGREADC
jgi:hypothetical protein